MYNKLLMFDEMDNVEQFLHILRSMIMCVATFIDITSGYWIMNSLVKTLSKNITALKRTFGVPSQTIKL